MWICQGPSPPPTPTPAPTRKLGTATIVIICISCLIGVGMLSTIACFIIRKRRNDRRDYEQIHDDRYNRSYRQLLAECELFSICQ
jgi:heme/copper-type cytochrome/quinol oxidase subunit 2